MRRVRGVALDGEQGAAVEATSSALRRTPGQKRDAASTAKGMSAPARPSSRPPQPQPALAVEAAGIAGAMPDAVLALELGGGVVGGVEIALVDVRRR